MVSYDWLIVLLVITSVNFTADALNLQLFAQRGRRVSPDPRSLLRVAPPLFYIQPMTMGKRQRSGRRLVLTLPKDNIHMLNAEASLERGQTFLPTTLTLSIRDHDSGEMSKGNTRYGTTRSYSSQIPKPPTQASRYRDGFASQSEERSKGEMDDLVGSSGGHVTVIKAGGMPKVVHARKVMSDGASYKPVKAIIIEPKEIEAKRVRILETEAESLSATKARVIEPQEPKVVKAKTYPVSFKKGEDWASSHVHFVKAPPQESRLQSDDDIPPMDLNCGGTTDLGWCDLGTNYPSAEVSQIMDVCEELVSRMFVEAAEDLGGMEDAASYSLSRNISHPRDAFWPYKSPTVIFKKNLCGTERNIIRPSFAQDIKGKWHVIIQTDAFPQRVVLEVCKNPGQPCKSSALCSSVHSQCVQKYSHHQLISFDPESAETCPYIRLYKFPTSCICRLEQ